jgi:hypothetical protein
MVFDVAAMAAISLGSAALSSSSARRAARRQREEMQRRKAALRQSAAQSAAEIRAAGAAAAAPLEREAQILRDTESLRNPILEQALTEAARTQAAPMIAERAATGIDPRAARFRIFQELLSARALTAREGIRAERTQRAQQARAALLAQSGQFRTQAASQAASIIQSAEGQAAGMATPMAPNTIAAMAGGALSTLDSLSDEDKDDLDKLLRGLFGGDDEPLKTPAWMRPGAFASPELPVGKSSTLMLPPGPAQTHVASPELFEALKFGLGGLFSQINPFGGSSTLQQTPAWMRPGAFGKSSNLMLPPA